MADSKQKIDWGEAVVPGLGLLFVLAYFYQTRDAPRVALFWPGYVAAVFGVLLVLVVVQFIVRKRVDADRRRPEGFTWTTLKHRFGPAALVLVIPVAYVLVIPYLGFSISNFLLLQLIFRGLGSRKWLVNLSVGLGITLFLHFALVVFMQLSLPRLELGSITI